MNKRRQMWSSILLCTTLILLLLTLLPKFQQNNDAGECHKGMIKNHSGVCVKPPSGPVCHKGLVKNRNGVCVKAVKTPTPTGQDCAKGTVKNRNGVCVKPKPTAKVSWFYPSDKPPVPKLTTPPDKSPPAVETSRVGGGGVTDNPTKTPSSESGVTAPSASPAPTTPRPTPSNEGGSNNGTVGGF